MGFLELWVTLFLLTGLVVLGFVRRDIRLRRACLKRLDLRSARSLPGR